MYTNIIYASLSPLTRRAKTRKIYSTDRGRVLRVNGLGLPERYKLHFANAAGGTAIPATMTSVGVAVPDTLVAQGEDIHAYIVIEDTAYSVTEYDITIPVERRGDAGDQPEQVTVLPLEVTENGEYAEEGAAYSPVVVAVPNVYEAEDIGKVVTDDGLEIQTTLEVRGNGAYDTTLNDRVVVDIPYTYGYDDKGKVVLLHGGAGLVEQTGLSVTENGSYDTTYNNVVTVDVEPYVDYEDITITENGAYSREEGYFREVTVNVTPPVDYADITFTENGTYSREGGYYRNITVNVEKGATIVPATVSPQTKYVDIEAFRTAEGIPRYYNLDVSNFITDFQVKTQKAPASVGKWSDLLYTMCTDSVLKFRLLYRDTAEDAGFLDLEMEFVDDLEAYEELQGYCRLKGWI